MRNILVDHARRRRAEKRGGNLRQHPLDAVLDHYEKQQIDVIALRDALEALSQDYERASMVMTLRYIAGFTVNDVADQLGVSVATVEKDTQFARAWLRMRLGE